MKHFEWDEKKLAWFTDPRNPRNYPDVLLPEILTAARRKKSQTLLDLGSGPGVFAIPLVKHFSKVFALDRSPLVLEYINQHCPAVSTIWGEWPTVQAPTVDITIAAYIGGVIEPVYLFQLSAVTRHFVFIILPNNRLRQDFSIDRLWQVLNKAPLVHSIIGDDVMVTLQKMGFAPQRKTVAFYSDQFVTDHLEAIRFLSHYFGPFSKEEICSVTNFVKHLLKPCPGGFILPNQKVADLICFSPKEAL